MDEQEATAGPLTNLGPYAEHVETNRVLVATDRTQHS
jgi:hypothetical protein